MAMFQKSVINKHLASIDSKKIDNAYAKFRENYNFSKMQKMNLIQARIARVDKMRDQIVYKPYELTEEGINIVEECV